MKIAGNQVEAGSKRYLRLQAEDSHAGFSVDVPLHVIRGASDGPTLVVQAGLSGLEIEPAMTLPSVVDEIDASKLRGTLIVVPLFNTTGFEFEQINAAWDDRDLHAIGRGDPNGTVSEALVAAYYDQVVASADALIDVRTGAQWGYFRYAGVYEGGATDASVDMAVALGLPHVLIGEPSVDGIAAQAAQDGKRVVAAWIGGGPGLRDNRVEDTMRVRRAVMNALQHLGMLDGVAMPADAASVSVLQAHTVLRPNGPRGFVFVDKHKRGKALAAGETLGIVRHPFTGEVLTELKADRPGVMVHAGASWPVVLEGAVLAILGDEVKSVTQS